MPKKAVELGALAVSRLSEPGLHFVGGVAGLGLQIAPGGSKSWVLRVVISGKRRDMGLGGFPDVTLAGAREAARVARASVRQGIDPIETAKAARSALSASRAKDLTFEQCAAKYLEAHEAGWKNPKHRKQWAASLKTYAYPKFGHLMVRDVELPHILSALEGIWLKKTQTATRVRGRIEAVLSWAIAGGYRHGLNPARWNGHLDLMLASPSKIMKEEHHPAVQIEQMGAFMSELRQREGIGARALELVILTACRSGEVRGAVWSEIDLKAKLWTIPAERMKAGVIHRVPLTDEAVAIIKAQPKIDNVEFVFSSARGGKLSDMTLSQLMRRMAFKDKAGKMCVPHGLRSTFRDWCSEHTNYPREVVEMALAHTIDNKVEAAYRRGDLLEKRRPLMKDWTKFCAIEQPKGGEVVPINAARVHG